MIEPTKGEIVDVLNNYLNSGSRDTFHQILIGRAIAEIEQLRKERDEARWEVCGFHHLTGFLAGDYANSRGWNYFNDERKWPGFPPSVSDFDKFLKGQDKIFLEMNDRLRKENEELRKERDEARRLYCRAVEEIEHGMTNDTERMVADYLGWDCFKEDK